MHLIAGFCTLISRWKGINHEFLINFNLKPVGAYYYFWFDYAHWISWVVLIKEKIRTPKSLTLNCPWAFPRNNNYGVLCKIPSYLATFFLIIMRRRTCFLPSLHVHCGLKMPNLVRWSSSWVLGYKAWAHGVSVCCIWGRVVQCEIAWSCKHHMWMIG